MALIKLIFASTREGRMGTGVAHWVFDHIKTMPGATVKFIDLKEVNLPLLDEPEHPRLQKYTHEHTMAWSKEIDEADGFIFVTPEYNYGFPASLKNALDYVYKEWNYKPVGFVSYGGVSGGMRCVELLVPVLASQMMVPIVESVHIQHFKTLLTEDGTFHPTETYVRAVDRMFNSLLRWEKALRQLRFDKEGNRINPQLV